MLSAGLRAGLAAAFLVMPAGTALSRDWHFFRAGFERLISIHCTARQVVHPERAAICVREQREAMLAWTEAMSRPDTEPEHAFFLSACRNRWSAAPHTNWVRTVDCAREALEDLREGRQPG